MVKPPSQSSIADPFAVSYSHSEQPMPASPFADLTEVYDRLVDWPKRLAREEPFYREVFQSADAGRVVDVACGTGRHAAMFHRWGLTVEAADVSPEMIDRARVMFDEPEGLRFLVRGFHEPIESEEPFDVAVCVGNSLALSPDAETVEQAVGEMLAAVRPGGLAVIHVLNLWRLPDGPCVWQKCIQMALPKGKMLVTKGVHRVGNRGFVDLVVAPIDAPERIQTESVPLVGLEAAGLEKMAARAGAVEVRQFGGYAGEPYDREQSADLIAVARKG